MLKNASLASCSYTDNRRLRRVSAITLSTFTVEFHARAMSSSEKKVNKSAS